jgi:hypothetical protein
MYKYLRNLKIYSEAADSNFDAAIANLDYILTHSNNSYEIFYSMQDKLNILSLLDSNYLPGGDNLNQNNLNQMIINLLSGNNLSNSKRISENNNINRNSKEYLNIFNNQLEYLNFKINNYNSLNIKEKQNLINHKILIDIMRNSYIEGIPSLSTKSKYLKDDKYKSEIIPEKYSLSQNYPNPFNPVTKINFAIPKQGFVTIRLYDILGREVSRLVNEYMTAGEYTIDFNAGNLSSGIYFYRMEINGFSDIKKMILIK